MWRRKAMNNKYFSKNLDYKLAEIVSDNSKNFITITHGVFETTIISSKNNLVIYICAFVAMVPDGLTLVSYAFPNKISKAHDYMHTQKIHYLTKQKKFPIFWRITTQAIAIIISIALLKYQSGLLPFFCFQKILLKIHK